MMGTNKALSAIPGPKHWPLLGSIPDFLKRGGIPTRLNQEIENYVKYGPIYKITLDEPMILICDPRDWYQVFRKEGKNPMGATNKTWPFVAYMEQRGVRKFSFCNDGEDWRNWRSQAQKHFFSHTDARSYVDMLAPVSEDFSKMAPLRQDDLFPLLNAVTFEVITTICYNKRVNAINIITTTLPEFGQLAASMFHTAAPLMFDGNPLHKMKLTSKWKEFKEIHDKIFDHVDKLTFELQEILDKGPDQNPEEFSRASKSYLAKQMQDPSVSKELMNAAVVSLMAAGVDTTAHMFSWLLVNLAKNQNAQERLYEELQSSLGGKTLSVDALEEFEFSYLRNCLKESMRLTPAAGATIRVLSTDINLRGFNIPQGTQLLYVPVGTQVDPKYFDDPLEYIPERWSEEAVKARKELANKEIHEVVDHPMIPMEFSFGPRMCLGARIAQYELMSLLTRLIQDYKIELADRSQPITARSSLLNLPHPFPKFKFSKRQ
jgi:cytochrome P450